MVSKPQPPEADWGFHLGERGSFCPDGGGRDVGWAGAVFSTPLNYLQAGKQTIWVACVLGFPFLACPGVISGSPCPWPASQAGRPGPSGSWGRGQEQDSQEAPPSGWMWLLLGVGAWVPPGVRVAPCRA